LKYGKSWTLVASGISHFNIIVDANEAKKLIHEENINIESEECRR